MIELYYWTTPNGHKITMFLEEAGLDYEIHPVNIGKGEQFKPEFLAISPNNRIPAIIDRTPPDGGEPISVFESGAILFYLANKTPLLHSARYAQACRCSRMALLADGRAWPHGRQNHHFSQYAPEKLPYAINRYVNETNRLYGVMNKQLAKESFLAGDYSIADMAAYPWIVPYEKQGQKLEDFPHLKRWFEEIQARPATQRAYAKAEAINPAQPPMDEDAKKILFGQTATGR